MKAGMDVRVAVIDDEAGERDLLKKYLSRFSVENDCPLSVDAYASGDNLLAQYQYNYDILLLDVDMPGTDGINCARRIRALDDGVTFLFVTNLAQYAIAAFEVEAADYIIKPVEYYDFSLKFRHALKCAARRGSHELTLEAVDGVHRVKLNDIIYLDVRNHYLTYHLSDGNIEVRGSMGAHEAQLRPYGFCRIHKSFLINLARVSLIRSNEVVLGELRLPIGRGYKDELMEQYLRFVR